MPDEAVNHLRAAHHYLTHIGDDLPEHPETAKAQFLHTLQTVTKHIQHARKLDPDAVYNYIDPKTNEVFPQSVDDLAGRSLYWEGFVKSEWGSTKKNVQDAIGALQTRSNMLPTIQRPTNSLASLV